MDPIKLVKISALSLLFAVLPEWSIAQPVYTAKTEGIGGAGAAMTSVESVFINPASLTYLSRTGFVGSSSMPYSFPGLIYASAGFHFSLDQEQSLFATVRNFGTGKYRNTALSLGYARLFLPTLSGAMSFSFGHVHFEGYGNAVSLGYSLALFCKISERLDAGIILSDIIPIRLGLPRSPAVQAGMCYAITDNVRIYCDFKKNGVQDHSFHFGTEYEVSQKVGLRLGTSTKPTKFHIGASLKCNDKLSLSMATTYHLILGLSPSFDITFTP